MAGEKRIFQDPSPRAIVEGTLAVQH